MVVENCFNYFIKVLHEVQCQNLPTETHAVPVKTWNYRLARWPPFMIPGASSGLGEGVSLGRNSMGHHAESYLKMFS